ncbi:MAG: copper chaperone PCu(A)C [Neisseriaceae bacterium]|nr:copper chaperone PCu(A)C [Neisseriaceae bacterium]
MKKTVVTLSALLLSVAAFADIHIENPRSRITAPTVKRGGAFMNIKNDGKTDDVLIAASTPRSSKTELHNTTIDENGVMKMREMKDGISVPAGQTVELKPDSLHVMFMDLHEPFVEGQTYPLTLKFKNAGEKTVTVTVKDMSNETPQKGNMHAHMHGEHKAPPPPQMVMPNHHAGHQH